jgi:hypothetical protein
MHRRFAALANSGLSYRNPLTLQRCMVGRIDPLLQIALASAGYFILYDLVSLALERYRGQTATVSFGQIPRSPDFALFTDASFIGDSSRLCS